MEISEIKKILKERRINYIELSKMSGIPLQSIRRIFSGSTPNPRVDTMRAIESALGISSGASWTLDDYTHGVSNTIRVAITPDEDNVLSKYREVKELLGENGETLIVDFCNVLLEKFKK